MIYETLRALELEINSHLKYVTGSNEELLVLSNIADQSGAKALQQDNIIYLSLLRIDEDKTINKSGGYPNNFKKGVPTLLVLYVMFTSSHSGNRYKDGIFLIDKIIGYFHENSVLKQTDIDGLPAEIDSVVFDLQNIDFREVSNIFSATGSKLMPHVIYKVRLLPVFGNEKSNSLPSMKELNRRLNDNK